MEFPEASSRSNLVVERHYVPRSAPRPSARGVSSTDSSGQFGRQTNADRDLASPGFSSFNSNSPNGYIADNSMSEISSMTGSVSSMPQPLNPSKLAYDHQMGQGSDSGAYSGRPRFTASSNYGDTDIDSVTGESGDNRYRGELFQPKAAPRILQKQVRQMYGEVHPRNLPSEELPTPSSGDELETMSEASVPSFADAPRVRPRASLRRKKLDQTNSGFFSDDESSIASQIDRSKSIPRSILKSQTTDISDAESLATSGNFRRTASGRTVRFQHSDKAKSIPKKVIDYEKLDSEDGSSSKKKKSTSSDPFSMVKPVGIKPARNDMKRSSGRGSQRGSQRGSKQGRQSRSSSRDRSGSSGRKSSANGNTSDSSKGRPRSSSQTRSASTERKSKDSAVAVKGDQVQIQMPESKPKSMMSDLSNSADKQKIMKWCLIVGVPAVLLIVVIIIVAMVVRS